MKTYYRIVHTAMGYMPQVTRNKEEGWAELASRPYFEYNEALMQIERKKSHWGEPVVIFEDEVDDGKEVPAQV